jgi:hypothetical protein
VRCRRPLKYVSFSSWAWGKVLMGEVDHNNQEQIRILRPDAEGLPYCVRSVHAERRGGEVYRGGICYVWV